MKIKLTTTKEVEVNIEFPFFTKSPASSTKWISEKKRLIVFENDIIIFRGSTLMQEHLENQMINEDEFNETYNNTMSLINEEYSIKQHSEHPELLVSEG